MGFPDMNLKTKILCYCRPWHTKDISLLKAKSSKHCSNLEALHLAIMMFNVSKRFSTKRELSRWLSGTTLDPEVVSSSTSRTGPVKPRIEELVISPLQELSILK
jgi:hypothetical protein